MSYYMPPSSDIDISKAVSKLQHMSNDELKQLLNDDSSGLQLDELIRDLPQLKQLEQERDMIIASNKSLAEMNLSLEPSFRQARHSLVAVHSEANQLKEELEHKKMKLNELSRQTSLDTTLALMQTAAAEAEEESENVATAFLAGEMGMEVFLKDFIDKKKLAHLRRIKTEKMMESIRHENRNSMSNVASSNPSFQPLRPAPPAPILPFSPGHAVGGVPGQSGFAPYPTFPAPMMPQPNYPFSRPSYQ